MKNYLNNDLNGCPESMGQVEPTPEPAPLNPEQPGDDEKEESM